MKIYIKKNNKYISDKTSNKQKKENKEQMSIK